MKVERADIEPLNSWSDRQFGDWLRGSLHDYFIANRGRFAFAPLHTFFGEDYDVTEEVMSVFALLTEQAKGRFKAGLSIALSETELIQETVVDAILNLARRTDATHLLRIFSGKVLKDWQNQPSLNTEIDNAIFWTIGVLARYAGESSLTDESVNCLETMARSGKMPKDYVLPLFKLLCEIRPTAPVENLNSFWYQLNCHFGEAPDSGSLKKLMSEHEELVESVYAASGREGLLRTVVARLHRPEAPYAYSWWQEAAVRFLWRRHIELPGDAEVVPDPDNEVAPFPAIEETGSVEPSPWMVHLRQNLPDAYSAIRGFGSQREKVSEW
ncbi:hypothetical protein [Bradyrhizobium sp. HKCCYLS2033]|uniref:hypothetical protein n=1 Tax=unclassified Bradyrhizobium TaxID=2631580 RepID=UPI003EB7DFB2